MTSESSNNPDLQANRPAGPAKCATMPSGPETVRVTGPVADLAGAGCRCAETGSDQAQAPLPLADPSAGTWERGAVGSRALPPAFPPWRRRLDPRLAAEDDNAVYQAFRERRTRKYPTLGSWVWMKTRHYTSVFLLYLCMWVPLVVLTESFHWQGFFIWLAVLSMFTLALRLISRREAPATLGLTASSVFDSPAPNRAIVSEVWLSGASGRVILEALYLERMENAMPRAGFALGCLVAGTAGVLFALAVPGWSVGCALFYTACAVYGWLLSLDLVLNESRKARREAVQPVFDAWQQAAARDGVVGMPDILRDGRTARTDPRSPWVRFGINLAGKGIRRARGMPLFLATFALYTVFAFFFLFLLIHATIPDAEPDQSLANIGVHIPFVWIAAGMMTILAALTFLRRRIYARRHAQSLDEMFATADDLFRDYLSSVIHGDRGEEGYENQARGG